MIAAATLTVLAYLCGSISSAVLVCRALGRTDPRQAGSGNPGATNVLRLHGKGAAGATLTGDVLKGAIPVAAARALDLSATALAVVGMAAFLGHLYPVFFGFRGGKGVATLIGVLLGFDPWLCLAFVGTWLAVAAVSRYSSVAALSAVLLTPLVAAVLDQPRPITVGICVIAVIVWWRHRSNIHKLIQGQETKIGDKPG